MRIFKTFFAFAALVCVGLLSACEKDSTTNQNEPQGNTPVINITDTTIEVASEGGDLTIELTITNAIGDVKVAAKSSAEWLTVKDISATAIVLNAAYNTEESPRNATLTVKYPEAEDVVVELTQLASSGDAYTIEAKDIKVNQFATDITAQNDDNYYVAYMSEVTYFKDMGIADEETLILDDYNFFLSYADAYGYTIRDFMINMGLAFRGDNTIDWTSLVPGCDYVVYVYGVQFNEDGSDYTVTTPIYYEVVTTPINTIGEQNFDVTVEVDGPSAYISIDPQGYTGYYFTNIYDTNSELYLSEGTEVDDEYTLLVAQDWMKNVNSYMGYYGYTAEQTIETLCNTGSDTHGAVLNANSDYISVTYAVEIVDGIPMLSSRPVVKRFTTGNVEASNMTFDVELNACYTRVLDFTVTPSNNDGYTILILNKSALDGITTDEEIIDYAVNGYWLDEYQGEYNYYNCYLKPETEYSILVFGYYGGVATTGLTRLDVKTEAVAPAENSVTNIVTYGPYDPVAIAELDPSYNSFAGYAGNFVMLHWLELENDDFSGVYHYIYDTNTVANYGDQAVFDDLVYYSYNFIAADLGAFDTEYVIAGVVQDYRGNYSDMVYSEPFVYTTGQLRDAQEFIDLANSQTRSGKAMASIVGRNEIVNLPVAK
jgi:hypothetical protein